MPLIIFPLHTIQEVEYQINTDTGFGLKGEWIIYRELLQALNESKDPWYVWYSYHTAIGTVSDKIGKTEAEIDFIIVGKKGVLVLEVKGGHLKIENNQFFCKSEEGWTSITNPFVQANQHKHLLREQFLKQFSRLLVCEAVALPSTAIALAHPRYDDKLIYSKYTKDLHYQNIEHFINTVLDHHSEKIRSVHGFSFDTVTPNVMEAIKNSLNVSIQDRNPYAEFDTLKWLNIHSLEVLDALEGNARLMIQGEAGTGKTTLALGYADRNRNLDGLYVCWNVFLKEHNTEKFQDRGIAVDTWNYFDFVVENSPNLTKDMAYGLSYEEFAICASEAITQYLKSGGKQYDYIIVDEAQDLFDRNIDVLLDRLCKTGNGLTKGKSLVLYDFRQSFNSEGRDIQEYAHLLQEYFAHYKLVGNKRSFTNKNIQQAAETALLNPEQLLTSTFFEDKQRISFTEVKGTRELERLFKRYIVNSQDTKSSLKGSDIIFLVQSSLLRSHSILENKLKEFGVIELHEKNINSKQIQYTTPIRFKGLERKHVVFFVNKVNRASNYEWYMAVTRAIEHVEIVNINF